MKIGRGLVHAAVVERTNQFSLHQAVGHRTDGGNQALPVLPVACLV